MILPTSSRVAGQTFVSGQPQPEGSVRAYGGRIVHENGPDLRRWRNTIRIRVRDAIGPIPPPYPAPIPVALSLALVRDRTASEPVRTTRPLTRKPDLDKLERAVLDALTGVLYDDDAQVIHLEADKRTAERGELPGLWLAWWIPGAQA